MLVDLAADGMNGLGVDDLRRRYGVRLAVGGPREPVTLDAGGIMVRFDGGGDGHRPVPGRDRVELGRRYPVADLELHQQRETEVDLARMN
ncbi:hypothetical protein ACWDUI_20220 [Streptosporangium sandarakinum]|uniref:hypothetical protein n=1 Tax=Streptosporangium sandarakinum TaxID=1260955 RepID=UPI003D8CCBB9